MKEKILNIYKKYKEIINYIFFGVLTTVVNIVVKLGLLFTILDQSNSLELQFAVVISWILSVIFAYFTNKKYVFESKSKNYFNEFITFILGRISTLLLEMLIMWFFITFLKLNSNLWVTLFTFISQFFVIVGNYIISKLFVFKKN